MTTRGGLNRNQTPSPSPKGPGRSPLGFLGGWQPLDRAVALVALVATVAIAVVLLLGDRTAAGVRDFSWADQTISARDRAFILSFNRPVERNSVESTLKIEPPLPGKISWSGPRMAYTLDEPVPYGSSYGVTVAGMRAAKPDGEVDPDARPAPPFVASFRSRDRAFAYIGTAAEEAGRLVLYNLSRQERQILTPPDLVVNEFIPSPNRDRILFAAIDRRNSGDGASAIPDQKLFTVTTGLGDGPENRRWFQRQPVEAGEITLVLDNQDYQNLKFDLSPDGDTVVVQRVSRSDPGEFGLWVLRSGRKPEPLESAPGGEFQITPDGAAIAMTQGEGVAILPLPERGSRRLGAATDRVIEPIDFLPKFGSLLDFTADGTKAAMVQFNPDFTRALYAITNQGEQIELGRLSGSILAAQFSPDGDTLFGLLTQLIDGETYREQPYLAAIDLKTKAVSPLLILPEQPDVTLDLAPDGLALLFDRVVTVQGDGATEGAGPVTRGGAPVQESQLWLLPIVRNGAGKVQAIEPQELPLQGLRPQWMP